MKKLLSISTTLRTPDRLIMFLKVVKDLEGKVWNKETQKEYQILLIKNRLYGFGNQQFYNGLDSIYKQIIEDIETDISFETAKAIFDSKNYTDPAMRGRTSMQPLEKFGFITTKDNYIKITDLGNFLLTDNDNFGEAFFKSLIKWQLSNPLTNDYKEEDGYDIKPFIATLHLIVLVNKKEEQRNEKAKGISRDEFMIFVPTLINYKDIEKYSDEIIKLREKIKKDVGNKDKILREYRKGFIQEFIKEEDKLEQTLKNLREYGDNILRYFRLTNYFHIRGNGYFVDLSPIREVEINSLLRFDNGSSIKFTSREEYEEYLANIEKPILPWEEKGILIEIANKLIKDINNLETELNKEKTSFDLNPQVGISELKRSIKQLRAERRKLQKEDLYIKSQEIDKLEECIQTLSTIDSEDNKPIVLEKFSSIGLNALNDAIQINPNYPVGDDNEPTFTAPANVPDIECFYREFNLICEVTILKNRNQWFNEGQPVMRHLRDFEEKNKSKTTYCLFIAPVNHRDTLNTFWNSIKYGYEGKTQKILPINLDNFIKMLEILLQIKRNGGFLKSENLSSLYEDILNDSSEKDRAEDWERGIGMKITEWGEALLEKRL